MSDHDEDVFLLGSIGSSPRDERSSSVVVGQGTGLYYCLVRNCSGPKTIAMGNNRPARLDVFTIIFLGVVVRGALPHE